MLATILERAEQFYLQKLPHAKTIIEQLQSSNAITIQIKPDGSKVTSADLALNTWLTQELHNIFPEFTIVSEEDSSTHHTVSANTIYIDPIDETGSFVRGEPDYAVLIGFVVKNEPVSGAVYYPKRNELLYVNSRSEVLVQNFTTQQHDQLSAIQAEQIEEPFVTVIQKNALKLDSTSILDSVPLNYIDTYNNCRSVERVIRGETKGHVYIWNGGAWDIAAWHALSNCVGVKVQHSDGSEIDYTVLDALAINKIPVVFLKS